MLSYFHQGMGETAFCMCAMTWTILESRVLIYSKSSFKQSKYDHITFLHKNLMASQSTQNEGQDMQNGLQALTVFPCFFYLVICSFVISLVIFLSHSLLSNYPEFFNSLKPSCSLQLQTLCMQISLSLSEMRIPYPHPALSPS